MSIEKKPFSYERYEKHWTLSQFGEEGQQKVHNSKLAIIGAGGLGCPVSLYLAAAGVGNITLIDDDIISVSNLPRQILYTETDVGSSKVDKAAKKISELNSSINIDIKN